MRFKVDCPHCEAMLSVPEKYHYTTIKCPDCGEVLEAVTTDTMRVTRDFIEELQDSGEAVGITTLSSVSALGPRESSGD